MDNVSQNNRVHGQRLRLNINCLNRISRSSLGSLKPKYLQQSFITVILDVLNNFVRKRVTAKSNECSSALVSGQTSRPYKRTGIHFVVTRCRTTSLDAILPTLPNIAVANGARTIEIKNKKKNRKK